MKVSCAQKLIPFLAAALIPAFCQDTLAAEKEDGSWFSALSKAYGLIRPNAFSPSTDQQIKSGAPGGLLLKDSHSQGKAVSPASDLFARSGTDAYAPSPEKGAPSKLSFGASLGDHYVGTQIDTGKSAGLSSGLQLSLDAGTRRNALNTGVNYTQRAPGYRSSKPGSQGSDFGPFFLLTPSRKGEDIPGASSSTGAHALFFYAGYDLTSQLNLRGAIGFARVKESGGRSGFDYNETSRRWGVDFAARYKLLDNLVYETHFGYVNIDQSASPVAPYTVLAPNDPESQGIYQLSNQIRMTF